jgi:hypothetical protein
MTRQGLVMPPTGEQSGLHDDGGPVSFQEFTQPGTVGGERLEGGGVGPA